MSKNAQVSWDDLIYVLAVADHGSVSAAARALSVNHATVLRRIAAFEKRQGLRVFDKTPRGYEVSADRRGLIETMREARDTLEKVDHFIDAERPRLSDGLRITSTDTFAQFVLPDILRDFACETGTHVEVLSGNAHLDFDRFEAHMTVRPAVKLPPQLSGTKAGSFRFGVYAANRKVTDWLGVSGPLARTSAADWLRMQGASPVMTADSFLMLAALAASGVGKTLLPTFLGNRWPGLKRLDVPDDLNPVPFWVASHVDYANSGRLIRARRFLVDALAKLPDPLD